MARIVELILTDICKGSGTPTDIYRTVYQLWTKDGKLVAESDTGPTMAGDQASLSLVGDAAMRSL